MSVCVCVCVCVRVSVILCMMSHAVHASMRSRMLASEVLKRQRPARICTHDGAFHCDEALACFLLSRTRTFRENYTIVRTRDVSVIEDEATDVVVDVGGVFDAGRLRFDHHQRSFDEVFGHGFNTKLSSAGLVYREFGKEVRVMMMCDEFNDADADADHNNNDNNGGGGDDDNDYHHYHRGRMS